jgi:hypothetical protein
MFLGFFDAVFSAVTKRVAAGQVNAGGSVSGYKFGVTAEKGVEVLVCWNRMVNVRNRLVIDGFETVFSAVTC